jgi:hypothetical protein
MALALRRKSRRGAVKAGHFRPPAPPILAASLPPRPRPRYSGSRDSTLGAS